MSVAECLTAMGWDINKLPWQTPGVQWPPPPTCFLQRGVTNSLSSPSWKEETVWLGGRSMKLWYSTQVRFRPDPRDSQQAIIEVTGVLDISALPHTIFSLIQDSIPTSGDVDRYTLFEYKHGIEGNAVTARGAVQYRKYWYCKGCLAGNDASGLVFTKDVSFAYTFTPEINGGAFMFSGKGGIDAGNEPDLIKALDLFAQTFKFYTLGLVSIDPKAEYEKQVDDVKRRALLAPAFEKRGFAFSQPVIRSVGNNRLLLELPGAIAVDSHEACGLFEKTRAMLGLPPNPSGR